ncbi:MAG TPA: NADH-quinone oxidoreductase subunit M, partial [Gemmataceae bacterium]
MAEPDLVMMSLVIFTPSAFALALLAFPRGKDEWMRWWALFGAAATLILSLCMLIDFYALLDSRLDASGRPLHSPETFLDARAAEAAAREAMPVPEPQLGYDFIARRAWIEEFHIDYA